jgi:hypothetical protein
MHPEILRQIVAQHDRDLREQAHRAVTARAAGRALRALRRGARLAEADGFAVPAIPDYVDGSFRTAGDEAASRVPAGRHAA